MLDWLNKLNAHWGALFNLFAFLWALVPGLLWGLWKSRNNIFSFLLGVCDFIRNRIAPEYRAAYASRKRARLHKLISDLEHFGKEEHDEAITKVIRRLVTAALAFFFLTLLTALGLVALVFKLGVILEAEILKKPLPHVNANASPSSNFIGILFGLGVVALFFSLTDAFTLSLDLSPARRKKTFSSLQKKLKNLVPDQVSLASHDD